MLDLLLPFRLVFFPFLFLLRFVHPSLLLFLEIIFSPYRGFKEEGFGGGFRLLCWVLRRRALRRPDGLQLTAPTKIDGVRMPCFPYRSESNWRRILNEIKKFRVKSDDIFVVSHMKCGHHFLHEVLTMLLSGEIKLHPQQKMFRFLEYQRSPQQHFDSIDESPRVILTHLPLKLLPEGVLQGKCRVIRISRNPKDMLVSHFHHSTNLKFHFYSDSFANFLRLHLESPDDAEYGNYFRFEREYIEELSGSPNVIHVTFENLRLNGSKTMKLIGEFLNLDRNEDFYRQVADATDFARVKAAKSSEMSHFFHKGTSFWRRGIVGDWRKHFTVEMNERVDEKIEREWGGTELETMFYYGEKEKRE